MDKSKSLWGELLAGDVSHTPLTILREQGDILTQMTKGVLEGIVSTTTLPKALPSLAYNLTGVGAISGLLPSVLRATLSIIAPKLDGYIFQVLQVDYELDRYPVTVYDDVNKIPYTCADEKAFVDAVKEVLSSEQVRKAIGLLLAQSHSEQQNAA